MQPTSFGRGELSPWKNRTFPTKFWQVDANGAIHKGKKSGQIRSNQFLFHCHVRILRICSTGCSTMIHYYMAGLRPCWSIQVGILVAAATLLFWSYVYIYMELYIYTQLYTYIIRFKRIRTCGCHRSLSTFIQYSRPSKHIETTWVMAKIWEFQHGTTSSCFQHHS